MPICIIINLCFYKQNMWHSRVHTGLVQLYKLEMPRDARKQQLLKCQITQEVMLHGATVAAHLFPRSAKVDLLYTFCVCLSAHFCRPSRCQWSLLQLASTHSLAPHRLTASTSVQPELAATWGLVNHANDVRNGLVWFAGIEQVSSGVAQSCFWQP